MQRIKAQKLSDVIMQQLEEMILSGSMTPGQKLPSERDLAAQFDVSRPSLREAMQKLESKGMLERKQGGGTYVRDKVSLFGEQPLMQLIGSNPESQYDLLEFRHALEGIAAYYAALRADKDDLAKIELAYAQVEKQAVNDISRQASRLGAFYLAMAEASHNAVLLHVIHSMQSLLQDNIERNLRVLAEQADCAEKIKSQRFKILQAIRDGDPERARQSSNEHLAFIEETLLNINRQSSQMQRTLRRIEL
ncbi:GntR family transcriptional regulator [Alteromonadaceae bacterium BrNp21-10]|nr:GntR family transcriptional regulator [Alteromonadaceae bacterium BrNp21-10]